MHATPGNTVGERRGGHAASAQRGRHMRGSVQCVHVKAPFNARMAHARSMRARVGNLNAHVPPAVQCARDNPNVQCADGNVCDNPTFNARVLIQR
jgi:hypothetical protein